VLYVFFHSFYKTLLKYNKYLSISIAFKLLLTAYTYCKLKALLNKLLVLLKLRFKYKRLLISLCIRNIA